MIEWMTIIKRRISCWRICLFINIEVIIVACPVPIANNNWLALSLSLSLLHRTRKPVAFTCKTRLMMNGTLLIILSYKCLSWLCIVSPLVYVVATPSIGGNSNKKSTVRGSPCRQSLARDEGAWRRNPSAQEKCISIKWAHGYNSTLSISPFQLEFIQERFLTFREWNFLQKSFPFVLPQS